ncbi:MAG: hypothetical protein ACM33T_16745 [Solirubrobacterales bacterium]
MSNTSGLKQPVLGAVAAIVAIALSLTICAQFSPATLGGWVALAVMSAIPMQIVIGLVWQSGSYPAALARLPQPAKGLAILAVMGVAATVVAPAIQAVVGGNVAPPTPFAIMYTIVSVCTAFWIVAVFQCWPMTAVSKHPAVIGAGVWVLAYVSALVLFRVTFDFSAMKDAPFYAVSLDPHGTSPAWNALSYIVTTVSVIMGFVMLDFWPTATIARAVPAIGRQPVFGVVSALFVLAIAAVMWEGCVVGLKMDVVDYMVRVPVSGLFGEFIMLVMMQTAPFQTTRQPVKGAALLACAAVLAVVMYAVYAKAAILLVGPMPSGAPTYGLDLWIATAMLSITFPVFVAFGDGFAYWPLSRAATTATAEAAAGAE